MNYLDFIKHKAAARFFIQKFDKLIISRTFDSDSFFIEKVNDCYFNEVFDLSEILFVKKLVSQVYGKDSYTYICWLSLYIKAKKLSKQRL